MLIILLHNDLFRDYILLYFLMYFFLLNKTSSNKSCEYLRDIRYLSDLCHCDRGGYASQSQAA